MSGKNIFDFFKKQKPQGKSPFAFEDAELDAKLEAEPATRNMKIEDIFKSILSYEHSLKDTNYKAKSANSSCWSTRKKLGDLYFQLGQFYETKAKADNSDDDYNKAVIAYHAAYLTSCNEKARNAVFPQTTENQAELPESISSTTATNPYCTGIRYMSGIGVKRNTEKALEIFKIEADKNVSTFDRQRSQLVLANMYRAGLGGVKDYQKAYELYQKVVDQGPVPATQNNDRDVSVWPSIGSDDDEKARKKLYQKTADQEYARAQRSLAGMYRKGLGVAKDDKKAYELYQKAADQGNATAQWGLAGMYEEGLGVAKDDKKACELYQKAVDQGSATAQWSLAGMYRKGLGVARDDKKACELYQKAADQGEAASCWGLGKMYQNGRGVAKDNEKACKLFQEAFKLFQTLADQGDVTARFNLGSLYEAGEGVTKDNEKALKLFQEAAEQGSALAQNRLDELSARPLKKP